MTQHNEDNKSSFTFRALYRAVLHGPQRESVTQLDIMALPPALVACFNKIARDTFITVTDFAETLNLTPRQAYYLARLLINKGYLLAEDSEEWHTATYKINYLRRTRHRSSSAILEMLTFDDD